MESIDTSHEEEKMRARLTILLVVSALFILPAVSSTAGESLNVEEFRKLYDSLLSGKTLVAEPRRTERPLRKRSITGKPLILETGISRYPSSR